MTPVIFRVWKTYEKNCFALLPNEDWKNGQCSIYMIDAHCGINYQMAIRKSRPATPEEFEELKAFMENKYGYNFKIYQRKVA